jgi:hypothetical protein
MVAGGSESDYEAGEPDMSHDVMYRLSVLSCKSLTCEAGRAIWVLINWK